MIQAGPISPLSFIAAADGRRSAGSQNWLLTGRAWVGASGIFELNLSFELGTGGCVVSDSSPISQIIVWLAITHDLRDHQSPRWIIVSQIMVYPTTNNQTGHCHNPILSQSHVDLKVRFQTLHKKQKRNQTACQTAHHFAFLGHCSRCTCPPHSGHSSTNAPLRLSIQNPIQQSTCQLQWPHGNNVGSSNLLTSLLHTLHTHGNHGFRLRHSERRALKKSILTMKLWRTRVRRGMVLSSEKCGH
jgi:hypothetical protein